MVEFPASYVRLRECNPLLINNPPKAPSQLAGMEHAFCPAAQRRLNGWDGFFMFFLAQKQHRKTIAVEERIVLKDIFCTSSKWGWYVSRHWKLQKLRLKLRFGWEVKIWWIQSSLLRVACKCLGFYGFFYDSLGFLNLQHAKTGEPKGPRT